MKKEYVVAFLVLLVCLLPLAVVRLSSWLIGISIFPPTYHAPYFFGGYTRRPESWNLNFTSQSGAKRGAILVEIPTIFGKVRGYYIPPTSKSDTVIVGHHANLRAVGSSMHVWEHLVPTDTHILLINFFGYGTVDFDRSDPIPRQHRPIIEAYIRAMVKAVITELLDAPRIDWKSMRARRVCETVHGLSLEEVDITTLPVWLPKKQGVVGRSLGGFFALYYEGRPLVLLQPLLGMDYIAPLGWRGFVWAFVRPWAPFRNLPNIAYLQSSRKHLTDEQASIFLDTDARILTGFNPDLHLGERQILVVIANGDDLMKEMTPEMESAIRQNPMSRVKRYYGNHRSLPEKNISISALSGYLSDVFAENVEPHVTGLTGI